MGTLTSRVTTRSKVWPWLCVCPQTCCLRLKDVVMFIKQILWPCRINSHCRSLIQLLINNPDSCWNTHPAAEISGSYNHFQGESWYPTGLKCLPTSLGRVKLISPSPSLCFLLLYTYKLSNYGKMLKWTYFGLCPVLKTIPHIFSCLNIEYIAVLSWDIMLKLKNKWKRH